MTTGPVKVNFRVHAGLMGKKLTTEIKARAATAILSLGKAGIRIEPRDKMGQLTGRRNRVLLYPAGWEAHAAISSSQLQEAIKTLLPKKTV